MDEKQCNKFLEEIMDDVVYVGKELYFGNMNNMKLAKGRKSLLVGQLNAKKTCSIPFDDFERIAAAITSDFTVNLEYIDIDSKVHRADKFNNAHYNRPKNELFAKWINDEYNKRNMEAA
jgi:hypothetical protein